MSTKKERAKKVVEIIINSLCYRKGFDEAFDLDEDILNDIKSEMLVIIMDDMK